MCDYLNPDNRSVAAAVGKNRPLKGGRIPPDDARAHVGVSRNRQECVDSQRSKLNSASVAGHWESLGMAGFPPTPTTERIRWERALPNTAATRFTKEPQLRGRSQYVGIPVATSSPA
jgi:hypothetical protein